MDIEIPAKKTVNVTTLKIIAAVRYDEEDIPNDFPGRVGDTWTAFIDLSTGKITTPDAVPIRAEVEMYMKVVDEGCYYLLDESGSVVASREQEYVPGFMPGDHYGDYLILKIKGGIVTNWKELDADDIASAFFPVAE